MSHFVIEFDHDAQKLVSMVQYDKHADAVKRWHELKTLHVVGPDSEDVVEAMMFEAASLDALMAACPQYFKRGD